MNKYTKYFSILIIIFITLFVLDANGQDKIYKYKYELGLGISLLGSGDITAINITNEFDYLVNKRFEVSLGLGFGKGLPREEYLPVFSSSIFQVNLNSYFIPINKNSYKLKVGGGISLLNLNQVGTSIGHRDSNGVYIVDEYSFKMYNTLGYSLLVENEFIFYKNISGSILLFGQFYQTTNTMAGGMLKLGYNF